jgi:hypothetical protein
MPARAEWDISRSRKAPETELSEREKKLGQAFKMAEELERFCEEEKIGGFLADGPAGRATYIPFKPKRLPSLRKA